MKKHISITVSILFGITTVLLLGFVSIRYVSIKRANEKLNELESSVRSDSSSHIREVKLPEESNSNDSPIASIDTIDATVQEDEPYISPIDFDALTKINPDIYAWIEIPGMEISYPILQREDSDQYYLVYSFDGIRDGNGSIYTHDENTKDFNDFNTIIYGHNLAQGGMFTDLEMYYAPEFIDEHREIIIYLPSKELHYNLYGVVIYNDYLLDYLFDFSTEQGKMAYVESLSESTDYRTYINDEMTITPEDKLITLSTCVSGTNGELRLLIVAALNNGKRMYS